MNTKKIFLAFLGIIAFVFNFTGAFVFGKTNTLLTDGIYTIESAVDSNKALDIDNSSTEDFASLQIFEKNGTDAQKFYIHKLNDGSFEVQALCSNKILTAGAIKCRERVCQRSRQNSDLSKWAISPAGDGYFCILSNPGGLAMSVYNSNTDNYTPISLDNQTKEKSQKFKFIPVKTFDAENYIVSTDKSKLQIDKIVRLVRFLGRDWNKEKIRSIIDGSSMCFGAYEKNTGKQVGFARVITDYETTCFIMNVVVDGNCRGKGIGAKIMRSILEHEDLSKCRFSLIPSSPWVARIYRLVGMKNSGFNYMIGPSISNK